MKRATVDIDRHTHIQHTTFTAVPGGLLVETTVVGGGAWRTAVASTLVPCGDDIAAEFVDELRGTAT